MKIIVTKVPVDHYCFAIKLRHGINTKYLQYTRSQIVYGKFIDQYTFEYQPVVNGKILADIKVKHCRKIDLLQHDNNIVYMFTDYASAKKVNDIVKKEFLHIPMLYTDRETTHKIAEALGKLPDEYKAEDFENSIN